MGTPGRDLVTRDHAPERPSPGHWDGFSLLEREERIAKVKFFSGRRFVAIVDSALIKNFSIRIQDKSVRCFQSAELIGDGCAWILKDREAKLRSLKVLTGFFQ
jgi:hypothetical protein